VVAYQTVNEQLLDTVMLRPIAIEDKAMVESESTGVKEGLMMQLGGEDHEMGLSRGGLATFHRILGSRRGLLHHPHRSRMLEL
jgi:hypothetical protein